DAAWPAIVAPPLRGNVPVLACACSVTVPLPSTALVGLVTVNHADPLAAVQLHEDAAVTLVVAMPPLTPTACVSGETVNVHVTGALCTTENVVPAIVIVPVRDAVPVFAATE